jgi:hypothetical protein
LSDAYHKLLKNFINHIMIEVQDAHNWSSLRKTCTATVTGGTGVSSNFQYDSTDIDSRSRLARQMYPEHGVIRPLAFDVTDATQVYRLWEADLKEILARQAIDTNQVDGGIWFATDPAANSVVARVHPIPVSNRSLQFDFYVPLDRFTGDGDLNTTINLPPAAVDAIELGATWYAYQERGEELGVNALFSEQRYKNILDAAIIRDETEGSGDDHTLVPV